MSYERKRNNEYFRQRLEKEFPGIHSDFLSGKYATVREASIAAGLVKKRTPMMDLRNAWRKADAKQRDDFLREVSSTVISSSVTKTVTRPSFTPALDGERRLTPSAIAQIDEILKIRNISPSQAIIEIDPTKSILDASLGMALTQGSRLKLDSRQIELWIDRNHKKLLI